MLARKSQSPRGDAQRIVEEATAYKDRVVLDAQGKWNVYNVFYLNLKRHLDLLKERLYIQTMEK